MLTARTKTIERTGTGRQFPPSLASLSATKFSLQIYMELTGSIAVGIFLNFEEILHKKVEINAIATDSLHGNRSNGGRFDQNKRVDSFLRFVIQSVL